jgi:hypothetical protein
LTPQEKKTTNNNLLAFQVFEVYNSFDWTVEHELWQLQVAVHILPAKKYIIQC